MQIKIVGGGLLPIAVGQLEMHLLTHCHRGQAPSHISIVALGRYIGDIQIRK
jgi:hypothetical protein